MADDILMAYRDEVTRLIHERDEARAALATMQRRAETAEAALRISVRDGEAKDAALDRQLEISERLTGRLVDAELALARVTALAEEEDAHWREMPAWEITVLVPAEAGDETVEKIRDAVWDLAFDMQPEDRDWDVFCSASKNPAEVPTHRIRSALAGRATGGEGE